MKSKYKIAVKLKLQTMKFFSKGDTTNWSYEMYKITEFIHDSKPT